MMTTLPDEWKAKSRTGKKRSGGGFNKGKKRPGGASQNPTPAKKKADDTDGKIVITADNPVSCLYEFAKKVSLKMEYKYHRYLVYIKL